MCAGVGACVCVCIYFVANGCAQKSMQYIFNLNQANALLSCKARQFINIRVQHSPLSQLRHSAPLAAVLVQALF